MSQIGSGRGTEPAVHPAMRLPRRLIIVRRGESGIFQALQESLDRWPEGTQVIWDRRVRDRRAAIRPITMERRRAQRRTEPDSMWYTHGFIVVETHGPPDEAIANSGK